MKHIVFLEQYGSLGGGQQVLLELVRAALHSGFQATVLIPEGPCSDRLRSLGAQVIAVSECRLSQGKKGIADIFRFAWYGCRTFLSHISLLRHAGLIYVNGNRLLPVALLAQLLLGRKAAYHIHLNHGGLERKLFLLTLRLKSTRALVLPSELSVGNCWPRTPVLPIRACRLSPTDWMPVSVTFLSRTVLRAGPCSISASWGVFHRKKGRTCSSRWRSIFLSYSSMCWGTPHSRLRTTMKD